MSISVSDTLVPGGSGFGIINAKDQNGGYGDAADEATIGGLASGKLVLNATWRKSLASGTTYLLTSLTPGGGFANGTWTPVATATTSGSWTPGVTTVTTANDSLSGLAARNGYTPVSGDRVLVAAQTTAKDNGIYVAASGGWSRSSDANSAGAFVLGKSVDITAGSSAGAIYILTQAPTVLGTDPIAFVVNSVGATVNWAAPGALGATTPNTVKTTGLTITTGAISTTTSDAVNSFDEQRGLWTALSTNSATTVYTLPAAIATSNMATITVEIWITRDASTDFGFWRRTICVRNQSSTLNTPTGTQTDTDISPVNNLSSGINTATASIDVTTNPPTVKVTRPTGIACHARAEVVDYPRGWSGV